MERIWAPWRMKYILGEKTEGCIFCVGAASADERRHLILHRGQECLVMMNRFPYNNGHVLIAPFRHVGDMESLDDTESLDFMKLLRLSLATMRKVLNPRGFNIGINVGHVAGAGIVDHVHMHVVPRWDGDTNFMPVLSGTKVINEDLEQTYGKLIAGFRS